MQREKIKKGVLQVGGLVMAVAVVAGGMAISSRDDTVLPTNHESTVSEARSTGSNEGMNDSAPNQAVQAIEQVEQVKIYRETNSKAWDPEELKKFNINFHTSEPLGIEVLEPTTINVCIKGDIMGSAKLALHDTNNLKELREVPVGRNFQVSIPKKGQLFLDVNNIRSKSGGDTPYTLDIEITLQEGTYMHTPTFDTRENKISEHVISDPEVFVSEVKKDENRFNGMLMISDNVRMYFPQSRYVPHNFDPEHVLQLHEDTIAQDNAFAGLDANDPNPIHHPRDNFVLVSARNEQAGYMSAGGQMLDTHPTNTKEYFVPGWGMYHEYGHLYEQGWSFIEIWNNMFSKHMTEQTIGFTWLWENDRARFESQTIKPFYDRYAKGETVERGFDYKDGLYFFVTLEEYFGKDFVATLERYWRENDQLPRHADYVAYAVAACYAVNIMPYLELYGLTINNQEVYNFVMDNSKSSLIIVPDHPAFADYKQLSVPATVRGIYEGSNAVLTGVANKESKITLQVEDKSYTTQADKEGKFELPIPGEVSVKTSMTLTTQDPDKDVTRPQMIKVKTPLSDNAFHLQGYADGVKLILGFDPSQKVLDVTSSGNEIHYYFENQEYFAVEFYSGDDQLKASAYAVGKGNANDIAEALDGQPFEYGDYIKISHKEPGRAKVYGEVINSPGKLSQGTAQIDLATSYFYITADGLMYSGQQK